MRAGQSAEEIGRILGVSRGIVLRTAHDQGLPVRMDGPPPSHGPTEIELINALYGSADVQRVLTRHGLRQVPPGGPSGSGSPSRRSSAAIWPKSFMCAAALPPPTSSS